MLIEFGMVVSLIMALITIGSIRILYFLWAKDMVRDIIGCGKEMPPVLDAKESILNMY